MKIKGTKIRMDMYAGQPQALSTITDLNTGEIINLMHNEKPLEWRKINIWMISCDLHHFLFLLFLQIQINVQNLFYPHQQKLLCSNK